MPDRNILNLIEINNSYIQTTVYTRIRIRVNIPMRRCQLRCSVRIHYSQYSDSLGINYNRGKPVFD